MAFRITVELPDECLKIVNFKSDDEEPPFEFECSDDKSTVLDVKKFINDEEALDLEDLTTIKIYWLFGILQDDVLVKDLLDQKAELYVSLPQFAEITSTGNTLTILKFADFSPPTQKPISLILSGPQSPQSTQSILRPQVHKPF